ncbi:MAG: hypothetical protein LBT17_01645 [Mycoplasmataceae bacterium]|jgi:predicted RND superfamily exporter protein|nr:hypothetical protein [Mycoplasmataceae bacterium]
MDTSEIANKRTQHQGKNKKKWLIALSIVGTAVIMAGAGIGVGYAIWNKNEIDRHYAV